MARGYLVAAVNHHGNTSAEDSYLPQGFVLWWERARDLSRLIDALLADPRFGPRIDARRIGAAGFSLGGYAVLSAAGALTDRAAWERFCAEDATQPGCALPPESPFTMEEVLSLVESDPAMRASLADSGLSYRDERVRAVYAMAPVLGPALDPQSLAAVAIPVRIVVGDRDDQALPDLTARPVAQGVPGASLRTLASVGHYAFLAPCTLRGRLLASALCVDAGGVDREAVHAKVARYAVQFFDHALRAAEMSLAPAPAMIEDVSALNPHAHER